MAGVTSPASPLYVHGMSLASDEEMGQLRECNQTPMLAVGMSARGYVVYEISLDTRCVKVRLLEHAWGACYDTPRVSTKRHGETARTRLGGML